MHLLMPVLIMDLTLEQNPYRYEIGVGFQTNCGATSGGVSKNNLVLSAELIV